MLPVARREGWTPWFALAVAFLLVVAFEPFRETVSFGQVNMLLLFLVALDLLVGVAGGRRWAGVGIGLATAIKLTPGVFIVYLLVTRRWRAALVSAGTAAVATLAAAAVDPAASREFWTSALWDTDRVGSLAFVSNQSLQGVVARLDPEHPSSLAWAGAGGGGAGRLGLAGARPPSLAEGLALTGVLGCLISPVTWVHHLVWLVPALILLVDAGLRRVRATPQGAAGPARASATPCCAAGWSGSGSTDSAGWVASWAATRTSGSAWPCCSSCRCGQPAASSIRA